MASSSAFAADFPEDEFREAILETMRMGMPESDDEKLKWWWNHDREWSPQSPAGLPYDLSDTAVSDVIGNPDEDPEDDGLIVDYAAENTDQPDTPTALGTFTPNRLKVTVFDVDWERIKTADYATIGDTRYEIETTAPPYGLFAVTMHDVFLQAVDSG